MSLSLSHPHTYERTHKALFSDLFYLLCMSNKMFPSSTYLCSITNICKIDIASLCCRFSASGGLHHHTANYKSPEVHQQTENDKTEVSPVGSTSLSHESHIKAIDNPLFPEHCSITHILYFLFYFTTTTKEPSCLLFVLFTGIYQREAVKSRSTGRDCKP